MLQHEVIEFLGRIHPFDELPDSAIETLCEDVGLEYFRRGTRILEQGGSAGEYLFVIKRGTVSMLLAADDGSELLLDYRGAGEYFGLLSLISGEAPRCTARVEEDLIGLVIPKQRLLAVLDEHPSVSERLVKSYFLAIIDKTYEETRRRYDSFSNGHRVLFSTPVSEIIRREPVATETTTSIQDAARLMVEHKISSVVVVDSSGAPVGIVTDRDLRQKIVAQGQTLSQPVSAIMSSPIIEVDASEPCSEALFKMMRHNIHHVLVTAQGEFRGMVTNHDFMVLQGTSPTLLVRKVTETHSLEHLGEIRERLERTVASLSRQGAKAQDISRVISEVARTLVAQTADLAGAELGEATAPLTVLLFGEAGRSELSLDRGPELALACNDGHDSQALERSALRRFVARFEEMPVAARFPFGTEAWTFSAWRDRIRRWMDGAENGFSVASGLFEMSAVTGRVRAVESLRLELVEAAAGREDLRARLVQGAVRNRPPLGVLRTLVVSTSGKQRDKLDLYERGIVPLVDIVRVLALEKGIQARSTSVRLRELRLHHGDVHADEIENAFEYVQTLRIHQQLAHVEAGEKPDNLLDPATLVNSERKSLKEAFQLIVSLYDALARRYGVRDEA